jgi:hypothetical protein
MGFQLCGNDDHLISPVSKTVATTQSGPRNNLFLRLYYLNVDLDLLCFPLTMGKLALEMETCLRLEERVLNLPFFSFRRRKMSDRQKGFLLSWCAFSDKGKKFSTHCPPTSWPPC